MIKYNLSKIENFSKKFLSKLSKTDCILLYGELGSGKTTFTRCLIQQMQLKNKIRKTEIISPTFSILQEYQIKSVKVMHYDLYRLKKMEEIENLGIYEKTKNIITIVEWPEKIKKKIKNRIEITFLHDSDPDIRRVKIKGFGKWKKFKINEI
tara:strand:- start:657 stop:1112 length:456 start_codon:yes stop_codon:yes gene_type:complete